MFKQLEDWMYQRGWRFWIAMDLLCWAILIGIGMWMFS